MTFKLSPDRTRLVEVARQSIPVYEKGTSYFQAHVAYQKHLASLRSYPVHNAQHFEPEKEYEEEKDFSVVGSVAYRIVDLAFNFKEMLEFGRNLANAVMMDHTHSGWLSQEEADSYSKEIIQSMFKTKL